MRAPFVKRFGVTTDFVEETARVALPLTYDEADFNTLLTWVRQGDGPHITPDGMAGNGYNARYKATASLPGWLTSSSGALTIHASIRLLQGARGSTRDTVLYVGPDSATPNPKLELAIADDISESTVPQVILRSYTSAMQTKRLCRKGWQFQWRCPEISDGTNKIRPQGVLFLDENTLLITGHFNDVRSRCYKVSISGDLLGWFEFPAPYLHVSSICRRADDGSIWFCDYSSERVFSVDIAASLASRGAEVVDYMDVSAMSGPSGIEWIGSGVNEYLLVGEYLTSGTPYLYAIPAAEVVDGVTFSLADRYKRFVCTQRLQGITYHSGLLYTCANRATADGSAMGKLQSVDIDTAVSSLADGGTLTAISTWFGPGEYVQDIDFDADGEAWTLTEGLTAVVSDDGWLSAWSSPLDGSDVWNHYTAEYNGSGSVRIKINGRIFEDVSWTPTVTPACISVGGPPAASEGQQAGYFLGHVRDIVVQDYGLSRAGYLSAIYGRYEPSDLTVYTVSLTNPGAESGTTGWTNETGGIATRSANPAAHSGANYFSGGSNAQTIARQRVDLLALTGLSGGAIDAATMWGRVEWWQASFGGADTDTAAMGLRYLDGVPAQISLTYPALLNMSPVQEWIKRGLPVSVPTGARNIDAVYRSDRSAGTNNDGYIDDITLTIYMR